MSDQIHFGCFSKAVNGFTASTEQADLDLFMSENPDLTKKGYEFSFRARFQLSSFTEQKYGSDATEDIVVPGKEFRIVSLKAIEKSWDNALSFIAVSSAKGFMAPDKEGLKEIQTELIALQDASKVAKEKWGDKACFLIW